MPAIPTPESLNEEKRLMKTPYLLLLKMALKDYLRNGKDEDLEHLKFMAASFLDAN